MGLLELVKKQINITSDENLKIEYMKANDISDILKFLKEDFEDFILVKRDLALNETDLISCYKGIVFTTKPKTLNSFDAVKKLEENKNIKVVELKNIGLNFISCGEILYAFSEIQPDSEIPNVLKIYPVHKKIFEENISAQNNNNNINIEISDNAITKKFSHKPNIQTEIQNENHKIESREKREKKLILKELFRIFNEEFTVVRIEFWGDIEDKKIGLTRFYNCHGISKGRLMGSWKLFDKDQLNTILDKGTLDCVLCGDNSVPNAAKMMGEMYRLLAPGGHYMVITYGDPEVRKKYLETQQWASLTVDKLAKPSAAVSATLNADENDVKNFHYIYTMAKPK